MLVPFVAIVLLIAAVGAIYLLLKSMGQDGVEVAAPGSCKSGRCGVQKCAATETSGHGEEDQLGEADEIKLKDAFQLSDGTKVIPSSSDRT